MLLSILLWGLVSLILLALLYCVVRYIKDWAYFRRCGIPYLGSDTLMLLQMFTGTTNMVKVEKELYSLTIPLGPVVGMSELLFTARAVYITDLELSKYLYVKDFEHFSKHRTADSDKNSNMYMHKMLFFMEGEPWRSMRAKLSPSFSTAKIRTMFDIFANSAQRLSDYVQTHVGTGTDGDGGGVGVDFDFNLITPKVAMDVISSAAFGVDSKCFSVPPTQMAKLEEMARRLQFNLSFADIMGYILLTGLPRLADYFGIGVFDGGAQAHFGNVVKRVMKHRRQTGERRNDFLQFMMDTQQGRLEKEEEDDDDDGEGGARAQHAVVGTTMEDDDIIANCMLFMMGGFGTTQSHILFSLYALALEEVAQAKVYAEVKAALDKTNGTLSYDLVQQEMSYMDLFLNETLRCYPPVTRTDRVCTKRYTIPGTDMVIEKGTAVIFPIYPVHHDPKYFPNPEQFDPDRFLPGNKSFRHPYAFSPFGFGPRNCIGNRFALMEVKAVIAKLVYAFKFGKCERTLVPMEYATSVDVKPKGGLWLRVTPRK